MLLRYAMMVGVAAAAVWAAVNLGARDSNMILVDAGQGIPNGNLSFWILGMIAGLMVLSLARVVVFGLPSMLPATSHLLCVKSAFAPNSSSCLAFPSWWTRASNS